MSVEKGNRGWLIDTEKFPLIRQLLELYESGKYSIRELLRIANEDMGLRTPLHRKQGGKKLVTSHITNTILKNPVFAGFFFTKDGERHELNESIPRAITEQQHWHIQKILGEKGRPRPSKNKLSFAYTGLAKCGCGGTVTAEHKYQIICDCRLKFPRAKDRTHCPGCGVAISRMKKPTHLHYIYYHCTRTKDPSCREGSVQELYIDNALASYFKEHLKISKALSDWCIQNLKTLNIKDVQDDSEKKVSLEATLTRKRNEYKELVLMKTRGLISDDEFIDLKGTQKAEIEALENIVGNRGPTDQMKLKKAQRAFQLSVGIDEIFTNGTPQEKKELLLEIGSNLTIKDKKLNVYNTGVYQKIIDGLLTVRAENPSFEPEKYGSTKGQNEALASVCPTLLRLLDDVRTSILQSKSEFCYRCPAFAMSV